jgi:hypothetical protein
MKIPALSSCRVAPIVVRADYNAQGYNAVLCNTVYGELDTINVHPLTEFVMAETTGSSGTAFDNWTTGASAEYCNELFANNLRNITYSLETGFNSFSSLFSANGTGFDAILRNFDSGMMINDNPPADFHIQDSLGSVANFSDSRWVINVTGNAGPDNISRTVESTGQGVSISDLGELVEELIASTLEVGVDIENMRGSIEGFGVGDPL